LKLSRTEIGRMLAQWHALRKSESR
jgi:hypothetical protein